MTDQPKELERAAAVQSFEPKEPIPEAPEKHEPVLETRNEPTEKPAEAQPAPKKNFLPKRHAGVIPVRDPVAQKIEKILEDNVGDAYSRLSPIAKQEFKMKGEVTARKIAELLKGTHIQVKKIFHLILEWLKMLPGVNRFFLEQEAKIKTDRIIALHNRKQ